MPNTNSQSSSENHTTGTPEVPPQPTQPAIPNNASLPGESPPQPVRQASQAQPVTFGTTVALCAVTAALTLMATFFGPNIAAKYGVGQSIDSSSKIVYLDFDRVLAAGIKQSVESNNLAVADIQKNAIKFQSDIAATIQKYADAGYVIINNKALINASPTHDITPDVIKRLGIKP